MSHILSLEKLKLLQVQSKFFPTVNEASTEIINLSAILELPKGTEHFLSDIHGEFESFSYVLRNASGAVKNIIDELFGSSLMDNEKKELAILICYPEEVIEKNQDRINDMSDWYKITLFRLIEVCRVTSSIYTRSKVRKSLSKTFSYIIEELLNERHKNKNRELYLNSIIKAIIEMDKAEEFIIDITNLIQKFIIDRLHIIGDIYDRGRGAEKIFDLLLDYHSIDIQWGNHDILWMGAASGCETCIANALRVSFRHGNLETLEEGYGINILPLASFALEVYKDDDCLNFIPKSNFKNEFSEKDLKTISKMHKAITIIQFKLEGQIIKHYKEFKMEDRLFLDKLDLENNCIVLKGNKYELKDRNFQTLDKENPYELTLEEKEVIKKLKFSFINNEKLQKHTRFLFSKGSMYLKYNNNLLYHGCILMDNNGEFSNITLNEKMYSGKKLYDALEKYVRDGYFKKEGTKEKKYGKAIMWYLWGGSDSPLYGKDKMATFENYFLNDEKLKKEIKNSYFRFRDDVKFVEKILKEFDLDSNNSRIINGHMPVESIKGENPIKANGKLLVIDGGFSKSVQQTTGMGGYTLIYNSRYISLMTHAPFISKEHVIEEEKSIISSETIIEKTENEILIRDTDTGEEIKEQIINLKSLVAAYRSGIIREKG